jgi:hypothetical protein
MSRLADSPFEISIYGGNDVQPLLPNFINSLSQGPDRPKSTWHLEM